MENVLEEYLVKLGIQFDTNALKKAKGSVDDFKKKLEGMISKNVYASATTNFVGAIGAITIEITKMVNQVAKADMQYQLLAQRMFMSVQATKAFTLASETMGNSLQEIAWNVELRERYFDLVDMVNKLEIPQESRDMLKQVRGIGHEFDRLKLAGKLSLEWLAVHILNLNKGGVAELKSQLRSFTETIFEKIPIWTKQLAEFLDVPIKLALTVIRFLGDVKDVAVPVLSTIWNWLIKIWDMMAPWSKQLVILSGLLIAVFSPVLGPIAAVTVALTAFFLLLEDFYAYCDGRKSSELLEPFWEFAEFLKFTLQKTILSVIVIADHLWTALKGKKHESGLGWKEHLEKELAELEKLHFDEKAERDRKREEAKKAIADEQAKEKAIADEQAKEKAPAPAPSVSGAAKEREKALLEEMDKQKITDPKERAAFLAQASHETGGFKKYSEGKYSAETVWKLRGKNLSKQGVTLDQLKEAEKTGGKDAMYEYMYGGRMGNIAGSGDAAKYKGRGAFQLTGRANYEQYGKELGINLVKNPELAEDPKISAQIAALYWKKKNLGKYAREGDITSVSAGINVGSVGAKKSQIHGLEDRKKRYAQYLAMQTQAPAQVTPVPIQVAKEQIVPIQVAKAPVKPIVSMAPAIEDFKARRLQTVMDQYKQKIGVMPVDMTKTTPGVKSMPQTPPGSPVYAKASEATSEETYNVNVTINAQTTDPKQIADEVTKGVKRSIQELRKEKFDKVRAGKVGVT